MLLRESGKKSDQVLDLNVVTRDEGRVGVENEMQLLMVAEAVCRGDAAELSQVRERVQPVLGAQGLADAIGVASAFDGITKIANATGLPLDNSTIEKTIQMREAAGINDYSEQHKVALFD